MFALNLHYKVDYSLFYFGLCLEKVTLWSSLATQTPLFSLFMLLAPLFLTYDASSLVTNVPFVDFFLCASCKGFLLLSNRCQKTKYQYLR
jgi:hypothetical protein